MGMCGKCHVQAILPSGNGPTVQGGGWATGPVWKFAENVALHWDLILRSSSLWQVAIPTAFSLPTVKTCRQEVTYCDLNKFCVQQSLM
jgi:hypothetical protein